MSSRYPERIQLRAEHDLAVSLSEIALAYASALEAAGAGAVVAFGATGMTLKPNMLKAGSKPDFQLALARAGDHPQYAQCKMTDATSLSVHRDTRRNAWVVTANYPSETDPRPRWILAMVQVARRVVALPGLRQISLERHPSSSTSFVPSPPLGTSRHLVTTTEAEVAGSYDDPESFWSEWDHIEAVGTVRLSWRGLEDLDEESWLARTFEGTMHLVRVAKPGLTVYGGPYWHDDFRPWWEYGDVQDEKAGYPALTPVGYDEATKTVELAGFITKTPLIKGGPEPRHVLIREIYDVRALVKSKQDREGRPVETVNITFAEEWMALSERRPLLDAGARVFYQDPKTKGFVEITA